MRAEAVDAAVVQDDDQVRILHGRDTLRNDDLGRFRNFSGKCLPDEGVRLRVDGGRRIVQNQYLRLL